MEKKQYTTPETRMVTIAAARMVCNSNININSSKTTTVQFSRESSFDWDDDYE